MKYNITVERIATSVRSLVPQEFIEVRTVRPLRGCVGRKLFCMITGGFELKFTVLNLASCNKNIFQDKKDIPLPLRIRITFLQVHVPCFSFGKNRSTIHLPTENPGSIIT